MVCGDSGDFGALLCVSSLETVQICREDRPVFVYSADTVYRRVSDLVGAGKFARVHAACPLAGGDLFIGWRHALRGALALDSS